MLRLALLWVLAGIVEALLYADRPRLRLHLRLWLLWVISVVGLASIILLVTYSWRIWLVAALLQGYRLINAARFIQQRLPLPRLNSVTLRAYLWLAPLQAGIALVCWIITMNHAGRGFLDVIALVQLACALLLVRSSVRTWRHTRLVGVPAPLTDKQLPTLSVLIPARNETDVLQSCLERLIACDYPKLEILVLDDNSTNRHTPEIIRNFAHEGVRFIQGVPVDEEHWLAKNHAYARLRQEASGELLLFCGVDAQFDPQSLRRLIEILEARQKDMLSILPIKINDIRTAFSLLQAMRYYWELCLPRRFFKRPPVLSTCWLIRATTLDKLGGFEAVSHTVVPEAYFARQTVVTDAYSFLRSNAWLGVYSAKPTDEQYATSVRVRYPQLHRRLELVAFTALLELGLLVGPMIGLVLSGFLTHAGLFQIAWSLCIALLLVTYYIAAVATHITSAWLAWVIMPVAFIYDMIIQHISLYKYEFARVEWKGRDIVHSVMEVIPQLPKL